MSGEMGKDVNLSDYFSEDQIKAMGKYEKTRNENLIRNYNYMKSIGLDTIKPPFPKKKENLKQPLANRRSLGSLEKDGEAAVNTRPVRGMLFGQFLQAVYVVSIKAFYVDVASY
ncbi:hypothetical protein EB796_004482 [Bugula neritina]|uniref:Uncharacterized protein n=1 Tax=Bugula neritina TaxID=10212 RepID=A0A7J7KG77_BUGNE|nr:hypothetical protein EB796_004482 [Bugula neritina]